MQILVIFEHDLDREKKENSTNFYLQQVSWDFEVLYKSYDQEHKTRQNGFTSSWHIPHGLVARLLSTPTLGEANHSFT
jgi:hypothetical protein